MLTLDNVNVHYGSIHALKGVCLRIDRGEIVTLVGANGAGKTTTLRAISGTLRPSSGTITFEGATINRLSPGAIVRMGISQVPEGRRIFPKMSVHENLELGAYTRNSPPEFKKDLEMVYTYFPILRERQNQTAGTLSGGEQQMLAIARALMSHPRLLLLDEPSLGLAPFLVDEIFEIIKSIHREGRAILLVEQNAYLALSIANRGYVLETGKIALEGTGQELLHNEHVKKAYLGEYV